MLQLTLQQCFSSNICLSSPKSDNFLLLNQEERNNEQTCASLKYFIFIVSARNLKEISCTWLRDRRSAKIIYYFYSSFVSFSSCPLPLLPVNLKTAGTNWSQIPWNPSIGSCRRTSMFIPVSPQWEPLAGTLRAKRYSLRQLDWRMNAWSIDIFPFLSFSASFYLYIISFPLPDSQRI